MFCRAFCVMCGDVYVVYIVCSVMLWIVLFCVVYFIFACYACDNSSLAINIKISHFD